METYVTLYGFILNLVLWFKEQWSKDREEHIVFYFLLKKFLQQIEKLLILFSSCLDLEFLPGNFVLLVFF